jgi:nitrite reductase/ring-hydroxylating ferredoxin subunit
LPAGDRSGTKYGVTDRAGSESCWRVRADLLPTGQTACFQLQHRGTRLSGFIVNHREQHYAYVNRCPHAGTPLDLWPNEFLTEDGSHLICATHGAVFEPDTGICVQGPCPGARLERLRVERDGEWLIVTRAD